MIGWDDQYCWYGLRPPASDVIYPPQKIVQVSWKFHVEMFPNGIPFGYLTVCHGKIHHAIKFGKPSISIRAI